MDPKVRYAAQTIFSSPNRDAGLDFESSLQRLKSKNQQAFKQVSSAILNQLNLRHHKTHDAIGDWVTGAENSVVHVIDDPADYDTARYAAAWIGQTAQQLAVLHFGEKDGGPDSLYEVHAPETDVKKVRAQLDSCGITYRTIIPHSTGSTVLVYDNGRALRDSIAQFAGLYHGVVRESTGVGELVGDDSDRPTESVARDRYRRIIDSYESGGSGSAAPGSAGPVRAGSTGSRPDVPDNGSGSQPADATSGPSPAKPPAVRG